MVDPVVQHIGVPAAHELRELPQVGRALAGQRARGDHGRRAFQRHAGMGTSNLFDVFGVAPVEAANRALARAGKTWADVDLVELNEA